jgi:hypothetical protein
MPPKLMGHLSLLKLVLMTTFSMDTPHHGNFLHVSLVYRERAQEKAANVVPAAHGKVHLQKIVPLFAAVIRRVLCHTL